MIFLISDFTSEGGILTNISFLIAHLSHHHSTFLFMNRCRSKHPDLIDLEVVRGSSKFEEGTSSEREEIVEGMG